MRLSDILSRDRTLCGLQVASKKRALEKVAELIASGEPAVSSAEVFECLIARERLGSTGLGHGVALPHGRLKHAERVVGALVRLSNAVDYDAADGGPVDLIVGLLLPDTRAEESLAVLARLAELFSDEGLRERLRRIDRCEELFELVVGPADEP
jgi:PTS system nitrogen regulatory IIA component